jgi:hypothetical protein
MSRPRPVAEVKPLDRGQVKRMPEPSAAAPTDASMVFAAAAGCGSPPRVQPAQRSPRRHIPALLAGVVAATDPGPKAIRLRASRSSGCDFLDTVGTERDPLVVRRASATNAVPRRKPAAERLRLPPRRGRLSRGRRRLKATVEPDPTARVAPMERLPPGPTAPAGKAAGRARCLSGPGLGRLATTSRPGPVG